MIALETREVYNHKECLFNKYKNDRMEDYFDFLWLLQDFRGETNNNSLVAFEQNLKRRIKK